MFWYWGTQVSNFINHEHRRNCKQIGEHTAQYGLFIFTFKTSKCGCCLHFMFPLHFRYVINLLFYMLQDFLLLFFMFQDRCILFLVLQDWYPPPHYPPHIAQSICIVHFHKWFCMQSWWLDAFSAKIFHKLGPSYLSQLLILPNVKITLPWI
jgi:hypothetical protein